MDPVSIAAAVSAGAIAAKEVWPILVTVLGWMKGKPGKATTNGANGANGEGKG